MFVSFIFDAVTGLSIRIALGTNERMIEAEAGHSKISLFFVYFG